MLIDLISLFIFDLKFCKIFLGMKILQEIYLWCLRLLKVNGLASLTSFPQKSSQEALTLCEFAWYLMYQETFDR